MFWKESTERDWHVIKGQSSPDLSATALRFSSAGSDRFALDYLNANTDVSLTFTPLFDRESANAKVSRLARKATRHVGECRLRPPDNDSAHARSGQDSGSQLLMPVPAHPARIRT
jgi:hypothetical protein